ncbi:MAG: hypothetical protein U5K71_01665 [Gracilimonas sp.]|nr:hypothetical protein [Gracilimonas sp.]
MFDTIGFNMHEYLPAVRNGNPFKIAYVLEENNWNGRRTLQLRLKDIHVSRIEDVLGVRSYTKTSAKT